MKIVFKVTGSLFSAIRRDVARPHAFAAERVGFISCRSGGLEQNGLVILAEQYHPVDDVDYLDDPRVGAMMGPAAIRKALQIALSNGASMFHVHMHDHLGIPGFSRIDRTESAKFIPDFFNVAPQIPHGALVLSHDRACGLCWIAKNRAPIRISEIVEVGAPMRFSWGTYS